MYSPGTHHGGLSGVATEAEIRALKRAVIEARGFHPTPSATVFCRGEPLFRGQLSRDLACLLDVDPGVASWRCLPCAVRCTDRTGSTRLHVPDFRVRRIDGSVVLVDAVPDASPACLGGGLAIDGPASGMGAAYRPVPEASIRVEPRLSNAKELLRYAGMRVSLGDRVRFLAMLEENGPTPISECLHAFRDAADPIAVIAALVLRRFISMDLDEAPIGPATLIRRQRD